MRCGHEVNEESDIRKKKKLDANPALGFEYGAACGGARGRKWTETLLDSCARFARAPVH